MDLDRNNAVINVERADRDLRFGIFQLLALTAIISVALAIACSDAFSSYSGKASPKNQAWKAVFLLSEATTGALCMTGFAAVVASWYRERKPPTEPGRILLAMLAFEYLIASLTIFLLAAVPEVPNGQSLLLPSACKYVAMLGVVIISVYGMTCNRWWWKVAFLLLCLGTLAKYLGEVFIWYANSNLTSMAMLGKITSAVCLVAIGWAIVSAIIDFVIKLKRSRLHWLGVACLLMASTWYGFLLMIASRSMSYEDLFYNP